MFRRVIVLATLLLLGQTAWAQKSTMLESVQTNEAKTWEVAAKIWQLAEPGYQEFESSKLLADTLEHAGFRVERGVAEIPTAFVASYGQGSPVIALLGEYDALPGLSQEAVAERQPREHATYGHACGHHMFGAAAMSAAIAVSEQIKKVGVVRRSWCAQACSRTSTSRCIGIRQHETRLEMHLVWRGPP
jgi:aminobenzoyl-glutamate utilization protein B